ncbi:MAG: hypothetical protein AAB834_03330, partial [Patescibacteria group bacterium]
PVDSLQDLARVNNFIPNLAGFGVPVYKDISDPFTHIATSKFVGRRQLNEDEMASLFLLGARPDYHAVAEAHGIDPKLADTLYDETHLGRESFMRMWILFPELTKAVLVGSLDEVGNRRRYSDRAHEEAFIAYNLMARLVDVNDRNVLKKDGVVNDWYMRG